MSTGTGVKHSEINAGTSPCRLLQIWIEPNRPGIAPAYAQKPFAIGPDWTPLLDPERRQGAMAIHRPVRLWRAQPGPGIPLAVSIAAASRGWIQMITGSGLAGSQALQRGDGLGFGAGCLEDFRAGDGGADLLLFELR
jgi:redox-sensitive bicupin YhaK (pirin superfamily)